MNERPYWRYQLDDAVELLGWFAVVMGFAVAVVLILFALGGLQK